MEDDFLGSAMKNIQNAKMCLTRPVNIQEKLIAIDDRKGSGFSGGAGPLAAKKYSSYFRLQNEGIDNILEYLRNEETHNLYENLSFIDHGGGGQIQFGDTVITLENFDEHKSKFIELGSYLMEDSYVHFWHCNAGDNPTLITEIANALGVPVIVSNNYNLPGINSKFLGGDFMRVSPNGEIEILSTEDIKDLRDIDSSWIRDAINNQLS